MKRLEAKSGAFNIEQPLEAVFVEIRNNFFEFRIQIILKPVILIIEI